jgi:hypothetical protein
MALRSLSRRVRDILFDFWKSRRAGSKTPSYHGAPTEPNHPAEPNGLTVDLQLISCNVGELAVSNSTLSGPGSFFEEIGQTSAGVVAGAVSHATD